MVGGAPRLVTQCAAGFFLTPDLPLLLAIPGPSLEASPSPNPWGGEIFFSFGVFIRG